MKKYISDALEDTFEIMIVKKDANSKKISKLEIQLMGSLVRRFFTPLYKDIIKDLSGDKQKDTQIIDTTFSKYEDKYVSTLGKYIDNAVLLGKNIAKNDLIKLNLLLSLEDFDEKISKTILQRKEMLPKKTLQRLNDSMREILVKGYEDGLGIDEIADNLKEKYQSMKNFETKRVARTEINASCNISKRNTFETNNVKFYKWNTAQDERVRRKPRDKADHRVLNGQIIRAGALFSNGLQYPHDPNGPASETVNCRCTFTPYILPEGYKAPDKQYFYESELVPIKREVNITR